MILIHGIECGRNGARKSLDVCGFTSIANGSDSTEKSNWKIVRVLVESRCTRYSLTSLSGPALNVRDQEGKY